MINQSLGTNLQKRRLIKMIDTGTLRNPLNQLPSRPRKTTIVKQRIQRDQLPNAIMKTSVRRQIKKIMLQQKTCSTKVIHLQSEILKTKERQSITFLRQNDLITLVKICTLRNTTSLKSIIHITIVIDTVALSKPTKSILTAIKIPIRAKMYNRRGTTLLMSLIMLPKPSQYQIDGKM